MDKQQICDKLLVVISAEIGIEQEDLLQNRDEALSTQFGVDSLEMVMIIIAVETIFDIAILDSEYPTDITINKMIDTIQKKQEEK